MKERKTKPKASRRANVSKKKTCIKVEEELEKELRKTISKMFEEKTKKLRVEAKLDLEFIQEPPIVGESVYGEAFPFENPPRIWLQVFAPDTTIRKIDEHICHELVHVQYPELGEESNEFRKKVKACMNL